MMRQLTAVLVCLGLMLAITPLDRALGTSCPGASASRHGSDFSESCPDSSHSDDSCPDDCQCLCCPGTRILHPRSALSGLVPPKPSACGAPKLKSFQPSDYVDRIFRPPRRR